MQSHRSNDANQTNSDELVRMAIPIVHSVVAEIAMRVPRFVGRDELLSAGMLGLAQASRSWDPSRGVPFDRFARIRIRGAIVDELRSRDWATRSVRTGGRAMLAATDELRSRLGRPPTDGELAVRLGCDAAEVSRLRHDLDRATVLRYDSLTDDVDHTGGDAIRVEGPDTALLDGELRECLHDAVRALPERLRGVILGYFFENREMQDLAQELGVTPSRVSQMCAEALALLKDGVNSRLEPTKVKDLNATRGRVARLKAAYYAAVADAAAVRTKVAMVEDREAVLAGLRRSA